MSDVTIDPNSPTGLSDGIAFRHQMMRLDLDAMDNARYTAYALKCHDQAVNVAAGRVDPNAKPYVQGQAGWPPMPNEALVDKNDAGFEFVEPGLDGPRTLDQVDGVRFPVIPVPEDHHLTDIQRRANLPQGVFELGPAQGSGATIFAVGPNDTMPRGITFQGPDGHSYMKFSWVGFGDKYQRIS